MSKSLVVVAHPDDESLWAGGYLAKHKTDVCVCSVPERDPERIKHFFEACKILGVKGYVAGCMEYQEDVTAALVFASQYDDIITHNHLGEYGHPFHIKVHHAMKSLGKPLRVFNYGITKGDPIDYDTKERAMKCYVTRKIIQNQGGRFDLRCESLLSY